MDSVYDSHYPIRANELTLLTAALVFKCMKVNLEELYTCLPCLSFITFKFIFWSLPQPFTNRKNCLQMIALLQPNTTSKIV